MSSMTGFGGPTGNRLMGNASGYNQGNKLPSGYKSGQLQQFGPEQMQLFQQLFGHVGPQSFLSRLTGGDEGSFEQMEAPAWRNLQQAFGQLGSRFSEFSPGAMSARRGSGFKLAGSQLASDFAQDLASRRQEIQRQALHDLFGMSNYLLGQRPYEQFLVPKKQNQTAELIGKLGGAVPGLISSAFGGGSPGSALKGAFSIFGGG